MKSFKLLPILFLLGACSSGTPEYDATGTFEATEVIVSAEASGKIIGLDVEEGTTLKAGQEVGIVDTVQLYLKKLQLEASAKSVEGQRPDILKQFADILCPSGLLHEKADNHENHVIEVDGLTKRFGTFTAVDHISFKVRQGEIFGFLGANGAGKTTAMRMLTGLSHPTDGKACVAGFDVATQSEAVKKNIGYMSQKFSLYEDLKVWENIRLFAGIYGVPETEIASRTDELLLRLGLEQERDTLVKNLPLGWKQKLAFSVSIFHHPKIVFLDEPTGGVDPATRRQFWELIYQAADQGITVFVTTHFMDEAEYCDRISIMVDGVIRALDTPDRLKQQFGAATMDDVFQQLAREAVRAAD